MPGLSASRSARPPVPVIVVAGFLGSGKTTLLNHLLRTAGATGTRLGVLVNDFGSVNIDALLVSAQTDGAVSLSNGCMCCTVDADGLADALTSLVRPSAKIDAIVIEARLAHMMIRFREKRSAHAPPSGPSSAVGRNPAAATSPDALASEVSAT